jgi:hypothetical protein
MYYSRRRTKGSIGDDGNNTITTHYWLGTPPSSSFDIGGLPRGNTQTTYDNLTSRWIAMRNKGVVSNNPFLTIKETVSCTRGSRLFQVAAAPPYGVGDAWKQTRQCNGMSIPELTSLPHLGAFESTYPSLISVACTSALGRIEKPSAEGGQFLGEIQQTLATLRNPIKAITDYLLLPPRKKSRSSARKAVAQQHLATIYGILPMIKDIEDILKTLYDKEKPKRLTARGRSSSSTTDTWTRAYNDGQVSATITGSALLEVDVRAGSLYSIDKRSVLQPFGLDISNIPRTAWELIPMSFVVDWFVNIGDYISAITPVVGLNRQCEWYSVRTRYALTETLGSLTSATPGWNASGGGDTVLRVIETTQRVPASLGDFVDINFNTNKLNVGQLLSSLSLIVSRLPK